MNTSMNKIYIIPDVHGRKFWRPILKNKTDTVIFLGDYSDPYPDEGINDDQALEQLHDIVEFKKRNKDRIILLLGNHDCSKINPKIFCPCRESKKHVKEYQKYFVDQFNLFQFAAELKQGNIRYVFTHAGITDRWLHQNNIKYNSPISRFLNDIVYKITPEFLGDIGRSRGGCAPCGSCIWADLYDHIDGNHQELKDYYQIFGHTRLHPKEICDINGVITKNWAMLDCQKVFVLENNIIKEWDGKQF